MRAPIRALSAMMILGAPGCTDPPSPPPAAGPVEWPNAESRANSDAWLVEHHDEIDVMRPHILVLDFANGGESLDDAHDLVDRTVAALAESSRPRGFEDPDAPAALQPEIFAFVDLRDDPSPAAPRKNSGLYPREDPVEGAWGLDYEALFTAEFAGLMDLRDPEHPADGPLDLCTAIDRGLVHEVWIYGDADSPDVSAAEILERKPVYDLDGRPTGEMNRCAGNGCFDEEDDIPCARTVRIGWLNHTRGPGCFLESLGHGFESIGAWNADQLPQLSRHFIPFANYRLDERYGLPVDSWYACPYDRPCVAYPSPSTAAYTLETASGTIDDYDPGCGNVHWPPNGRQHYDLANSEPVLTSCDRYGDGGEKTAFTNAAFAPYLDVAPDCMGPYLVWWRQNWPGPHTTKIDDDGTPMKSWWPYIYY